MKTLIVSRHPATVEFIRQEMPELFGDAPVLESATPEDVREAIVAGNLPLNLAAECRIVYAVLFRGAPPRGQEYGPDELRAAGAYMAPFETRPVTQNDRPCNCGSGVPWANCQEGGGYCG